jgi:site-specific DNA-methyltransferase (adenine-specific)
MSIHRIIFGDSRQMPEIADRSVHLVVTSPPYWCIKDYEHRGQIGYNQPYEAYLDDLTKVLAECHRVLCPGCRAVINIGDQYLRATDHGRYRVQPIPADIITIGRKVGFDFMGNIIWEKISTTRTTGGGQWMGSIYYPRDGHITYEHEYIILLRKKGQWPKPSKQQREKSKLTPQQRSEWFRGVWKIAPERQEKHAAMFPVEVPRRLIKMYSFYGETVLDPFLGSGTTSFAAALEGRNSIGYEINQESRSLIEERMRMHEPSLLEQPAVSIEHREVQCPSTLRGSVHARGASPVPMK